METASFILDFNDTGYKMTTVRIPYPRNYTGSIVQLRQSILWYQAVSSVDIDLDGKQELLLVPVHMFNMSYLYIIKYGESGYYVDRIINATELYIEYTGSKPKYMSIETEAMPINIDDDNYPELLLPTTNGLIVLDDYYANFSVMNIIFAGRSICAPIQVSDVDSDGDLDALFVVSNTGTFVVEVPSGEVLGSFEEGPRGDSLVLYSVDIDGDGSRELIGFGYYEDFVLADLTSGKLTPLLNVCEEGVYNDIFEEPSFADIDFDGCYEIITCAITDCRQNVSLLVIDDDLRSVRRIVLENVTYGIVQRPAIGDINGDGILDIVIGAANTAYFIDGRNLSLMWAYNFSKFGDVFAAYNLIGDVDGDGFAEVISLTDCRIVVFNTIGYGSPWPTYNIDNYHSCCVCDEDRDGIADYLEPYYNLNPQDADTDGDGLRDGEEFFVIGTDPLCADTDGDGLSDYIELKIGSNPNDPQSPRLLLAFLLIALVAIIGFILVRRRSKHD